FLLTQKTTWDSFLQSNNQIYVWLQVMLSIGNAILIGISISMLFSVLEERKNVSKGSLVQTLGSLLFSAAATGCSVCSAFLLPALGIAASLTALPFGGLEIKAISILLLIYAIYEYAKPASGLCEIESNLSKKIFYQLKPFIILLLFIVIIYSLPQIPSRFRIRMQNETLSANQQVKKSGQTQNTALFSQINPPEGYEINASFGDIGPQMIDMGVIDLDKFKATYDKSGQSLTKEQLSILTKGSNQKIKITPENSYFLLNFFWAFGLANKSKFLTEGDMITQSNGQPGTFASTGGLTLTKSGDSMQYYAKRALVRLTANQEKLVYDVASNVYRPCCGNSTAFPDCNHGMALLGIYELMASQGATQSQMYQAGKYINSFWFPSNAFDAALYFKSKYGQEFKDIDPKAFLSKDIFSAFGAQNVKAYLVEKGIQEKPPAQGGGCGV
ncbi:MAG: hypothetical protein AAB929_01445, partial [Patescibacteria group bacterium]